MQITLNREKAMKAVDVARNFAAGASGLDVLQGVLLSAEPGRARLTTTDLELWCQVELEAQTAQPGKALLPVRGLGTVLKNMPLSRVELRRAGGDAVCEAGSSEVRLACMDAGEYPDIEEPQGLWMSMPLAAALVDRVAYAASRDETRYTLCGVLVEVEDRRLRLVATDGQRLARFEGMLPPGSECDAGEGPVQAIVPVRLFQEGMRLGGKLGGSATFELYEKAAAIRMNGAVRMWSRLIEGQYPAYEEALPSERAGTVTVPKGALWSAVTRLAALSKGRRQAGVALCVEDGRLVMRLEADAGDGISAVERLTPARIDGTVPACGLRIRYLSEALARLPELALVELGYADDKGSCPVVVQGAEAAGAGLLAVIMPYELVRSAGEERDHA